MSFRREMNALRAASLLRMALPILAAASPALAQVGSGQTITNNNAVFTLNDYTGGQAGTGASTVFSVNGNAGANNLGQAWWWGRVQGSDPREFAVTVSNAASSFSKSSQADSFTLTYNYNRTVGATIVPVMKLEMTYTVIGLGISGAQAFGKLVQSVTVTNMTGTGASNPATAFTYNLFNYNNLAVFGTNGNKTAVQTGPNSVRFIDGLNPLRRADYDVSGPGATIQVTSTTASSVRNVLTDGNISNLVNSIFGGPANLEVASQFVFNLAAGQSQSASVVLTIPTPGAAALAALGAVTMIGFRRRRGS